MKVFFLSVFLLGCSQADLRAKVDLAMTAEINAIKAFEAYANVHTKNVVDDCVARSDRDCPSLVTWHATRDTIVSGLVEASKALILAAQLLGGK